MRESGKPFAFVLNQAKARSTRAIELKMSDVLALPAAIVLRNDQQYTQDACRVTLAVLVDRAAPRRLVGPEWDPSGQCDPRSSMRHASQ